MSCDMTVQCLLFIDMSSKQLLGCTLDLDGNAGTGLTFLYNIDRFMILLDGSTTISQRKKWWNTSCQDRILFALLWFR